MECKIDLANYTCQLNDPIDAICSDAHFNNVAIIQRCKKEASRSSMIISILEVNHDKLKVLKSMPFKYGKISQASPCSIAWSPINDSLLASTTPLGTVLVWDVNGGSIREKFECTNAYTAIKFHNFDRNLFATGSTDTSLFLYDLRVEKRHKPVTSFSGNHMSIRDIELGRHPDTSHQLVAVGDGGNIKFWDMRMVHKHVKEIPAHNGQIMSVVLNRTHKHLLATGGRDKFIRVWDSSKNESSLHSIETPSAVGKVAWTNESDWHVCSFSAPFTNRETSDCGLYIWDLRRPFMPYKHFQRHEDVITDIIFPDDASREIFISCDVGGKVLLHKTTLANIPIRATDNIAIACSTTSNECAIATPKNAGDFYPENISHSEDFARRVQSRIVIAPTSEIGSDSEKFRYLAQRYKLICPNGEGLNDLCKYNSQVARSIGDIELSRAWELLGILAGDDQISTIRPMLGEQIRPKTKTSPFYFQDTRDSTTEEGGSGSQQHSPIEEMIEVFGPNREFCYDQELLEFSGVLEEESCLIPGFEEITTAKVHRQRRRRYAPRMKIIEREEWYTGPTGLEEEINQKKMKIKRVHRYFGGMRQRLAGVRFQNTKDGQIKRTCISFVFDNSKAVKIEGKKPLHPTLEKIKATYDERVAARKKEVAEAERKKRKKSLTKDQKEMLHDKRVEKKIREQNMRWIEENKILQLSRAPITEIQRIIVERTKMYHAKQASIEANEFKNKRKTYIEGYKPPQQKDQWEMIQLIFDYYKALDDVQMVACMSLCIGEKVTMLIPENTVDRWFNFYIDLLEQYSLFKEATFFMKASFRIQAAQRNNEDLFVNNICVECGNQLKSPICDKCANEHFCIICENLVYGSWMICADCGHGGHPEHIKEWFNQHDNCPAAFCDHSCFPARRKSNNNNASFVKRQKTRSGSPTLSYHYRARHGGAGIEDADFWKHKIPPH